MKIMKEISCWKVNKRKEVIFLIFDCSNCVNNAVCQSQEQAKYVMDMISQSVGHQVGVFQMPKEVK